MILIKKLRILYISLFILGVLLNLITSKTPQIVEKYYSNGINIFMVKILSNISSILPFSLFEIFIYVGAIAILSYFIYCIFNITKNTKETLYYLKNMILNIISIFGIIYFLFIILWGINYNRMDLEDSLIEDYNKTKNLNIKKVEYDNENLKQLYKFLINQCNETRDKVSEDENKVMKCDSNIRHVLKRATKGYDNVHILNLNEKGTYGTAKYILNSNLLCYTGITGIYSPFTGEANINVASPDIYIPFTTLHEMAHQRGYASEDEANFLAYIACINNEDYDFQYSGYLLALKYTASALAKVDYNALVSANNDLSSSVINDLNHSSEFWKQFEGKVNEVSDDMNSNYLKANGVKEGTLSYGKVVNLLLTYYSLYGFK